MEILDPNNPQNRFQEEMRHNIPKDFGSYTISYAALGTLFNNDLTGLFQTFEENRLIVARRLSDNPAIRAKYHMRHRAGVGVTEHSDALVVIVSEERGEITVARAGILTPVKSPEELLQLLSEGLTTDAEATRRRSSRRAKRTEEETGEESGGDDA